MRAAHLHYLLIRDAAITELDAPALVLTASSRGKYVLVGPSPARDELARLVGPGLLAELLASGKPMVVDSIPDAYLFYELARPQHKEQSRERD
jgi:hypothetical protein